MTTVSDFVVAIPARYAATRLPGKPLQLLAGERLHVDRFELQTVRRLRMSRARERDRRDGGRRPGEARALQPERPKSIHPTP